jgi:hypothetical protein
MPTKFVMFKVSSNFVTSIVLPLSHYLPPILKIHIYLSGSASKSWLKSKGLFCEITSHEITNHFTIFHFRF